MRKDCTIKTWDQTTRLIILDEPLTGVSPNDKSLEEIFLGVVEEAGRQTFDEATAGVAA